MSHHRVSQIPFALARLIADLRGSEGSARPLGGMTDFSKFPHEPTISIKPFTAHCSDEVLADLKHRVNDSESPRKTYENTTATDRGLGLARDWLVKAIDEWKTFDWRGIEDEVNGFPNFKAHLYHEKHEYDIHFMALFSHKEDAIPVVMMHGWPGCFLEFVPMLRLLSSRYSPSTLPIHLIVPSLIGFGYSSPPPIDVDFGTRDNAPLIDQLMAGMGLTGYVAQGGDIGSFVARFIAQTSTICKAVHLDFVPSLPPDTFDESTLDLVDQACVKKLKEWNSWERAYVQEHATKTATIAAVVESSSGSARLFIGWSDETPSIHTILSMVTMYWITNTFPTSIYHYRVSYGRDVQDKDKMPPVSSKALGYSQFTHEIMPSPRVLVEQAGNNVVWHRRHERAGHFSALEDAETLWDDVHDFIEKVVRKL
ncbi:Alpha/Beta hydrolase protein [Kockovaella imperatae]|uniref:Alpha/Beta hydrolase protein n=1 Tax=Kockovaella imperatae TaxID=4999 RepID=A0A1Y1UM89_9TREE|nr:Alpha/Beta hydrolase protein [Kockovaella imperatae]ORX39119.1 Alpha/Beta hydrolase protein [Kockovaella imperatae]